MLDVVFDYSFMSGTSLGHRCSPFKGSTVPVTSVLNLTDRQCIAESKAAASKRQPPRQTPLTVNNGYGPPQEQWRPANAPPPLRGSFSGAMNGRGRGGHDNLPIRGGNPNRGRGRGGRGGYTIVDNSDPMENVVRNNLSFRPQNMSAVPPPAILNNDYRGRGRGRGRGEGRGRGAGRGAPRGRGGAVNGDGNSS